MYHSSSSLCIFLMRTRKYWRKNSKILTITHLSNILSMRLAMRAIQTRQPLSHHPFPVLSLSFHSNHIQTYASNFSSFINKKIDPNCKADNENENSPIALPIAQSQRIFCDHFSPTSPLDLILWHSLVKPSSQNKISFIYLICFSFFEI